MGRAALIAGLMWAAVSAAQERGETHAGFEVYAQPASGDWLLVITPAVSAKVAAAKWLRFDAHVLADVVTGATPREYGPPDVVTAATQFSEQRVVLGGGAEADVGPLSLSAGYAYGTEHDYRSNLLRAGAKLDLARHNSILAFNYSHSFDRICNLDQSGVPILLRQPLDRPNGCFAATPGLAAESLDVDTAELTFTQTLTRTWIGSVIGSYQHLDGFQSNPYRRVRLDGGLFQPEESHPARRDRGAVTLRVRHALDKLRASLGGDLRLYRDDWGVQSLTAEASWEAPFHPERPRWRYFVHARGYLQSGAAFYRDAGNADSYDRKGPVGSYFTADQALAPLADLIVGARFSYANSRDPEHRYWRMFTDAEVSLLFDYVKAFALTPDPPNAARTRGFASALVFGASLSGKF